jgi:hypothetical protein
MPTPRLIPGQGNFFAELTPQVPLDPSIVFIPSPTEDPRLAPLLNELATTRYFGLDLQYYGPWTKISDIDYTKAIIRLIQVGLPSGLTLIIDLGAITSNRQAIQQHPQVIQAWPILSCSVARSAIERACRACMTWGCCWIAGRLLVMAPRSMIRASGHGSCGLLSLGCILGRQDDL